MSYSDFDLKSAKAAFGLTIEENQDLFGAVAPVAVSSLLATLLEEAVPLALAIGTEKASSELIIINILLELKRHYAVSLFSGVEFTVNKEQGLNGFCDFIISRSAEQLYLDVPIVAIVEAKNERIAAGYGQCVAEMVAAQIYNQRDGKSLRYTYGIVTTGHAWKFIRLEGSIVCIDREDYYINNPAKILGILASMIE